jgi:hypothetical protein
MVFVTRRNVVVKKHTRQEVRVNDLGAPVRGMNATQGGGSSNSSVLEATGDIHIVLARHLDVVGSFCSHSN